MNLGLRISAQPATGCLRKGGCRWHRKKTSCCCDRPDGSSARPIRRRSRFIPRRRSSSRTTSCTVDEQYALRRVSLPVAGNTGGTLVLTVTVPLSRRVNLYFDPWSRHKLPAHDPTPRSETGPTFPVFDDVVGTYGFP